MIDTIFQTLAIAINENNEEKIKKAKNLFGKILYEIIDHRVESILSERKGTSHDRILAADSINSTVKSTATAIRTLSALNSAPPPADDYKDDWEEWMAVYRYWYTHNREDGLKIK